MSIFDKIFSQPVLQNKPPVLIDVGASEKINQKWKRIAKYSICIAFDGDERDFEFTEKSKSEFKKLYTFHSLVSDKTSSKTKFYLTKSPYCSSVLIPNTDELKNWSFNSKFKIEKEIFLKSTTINSSLKKLNLNYIDWFKTDSQGLDLRIFKSISEKIKREIIIVEFEPGLIHAYLGEDKFEDILTEMQKTNFWISSSTLMGDVRITEEELNLISKNKYVKKIISSSLKQNPGWIEIAFSNDFTKINSERKFLLGWVFAIIEENYGFALKLSQLGCERFENKIFKEMRAFTIHKLRFGLLNKYFFNTVKTKISKLF